MTLNAAEPTDQRFVSELPAYIRAVRAAINAIEELETEIVTSEIHIPDAASVLVVGEDLADKSIEVVIVTGYGTSVIEKITGGTEGQFKLFIMQNNNMSFKDGLKLDGKLYLNQLPALTNFDAQQDDVLALVNIGGSESSEGYWKEVWRQISVK